MGARDHARKVAAFSIGKERHMILICYDGSADAQAAIDRAGELLSGRPATVLSVWEGMAEVLARTGSGFAIAPLDFEQLDADSERSAGERAEEGAARARAAGLDASAHARERGATIWATVLEEAEEVGASAIVLGSRGLTGVKSLLLGSVSHAVLQHADRPVIIIPSPAVAAERAQGRGAG
jgi:nucleotide-binding universal stress UspA family protein